jgi:hypothetical protein
MHAAAQGKHFQCLVHPSLHVVKIVQSSAIGLQGRRPVTSFERLRCYRWDL